MLIRCRDYLHLNRTSCTSPPRCRERLKPTGAHNELRLMSERTNQPFSMPYALQEGRRNNMTGFGVTHPTVKRIRPPSFTANTQNTGLEAD